jgi:glucosamine 6-phosphate synthetase-like amidotransferase/phosphosugar isomerase protein
VTWKTTLRGGIWEEIPVLPIPAGPPTESPTTSTPTPITVRTKKLAIIHNGIIENYASLREELSNRGYHFISDTDTEVLIHLIEDILLNDTRTMVHPKK